MSVLARSVPVCVVVFAGALVASPCPAEARDLLRFSGDGTVSATADGGSASGTVSLTTRVRGRREVSILDLRVTGIPVGGATRPDLTVHLVETGGAAEYAVGRLRVSALGIARLRRGLARALGSRSVSARRIALAGGTIEIRRRTGGQEVILSGTLPTPTQTGVGISTSTQRVFGTMNDPRDAADVRPPRDDDLSSGSLPLGFELDQLHRARFELRSDRFADGSTRDRLSVVSTPLPSQVVFSRSVRTAAYDLRLFTSSGALITFGRMTLDPRESSFFSVDTERAAAPGGLPLTSYSGGVIEVRRVTPTNVAVLEADIPEFRDVGDRGLAQHQARAFGVEELTPVDANSTAAGRMSARLDVFPRRRTQRITLAFVDLPAAGSPYTVDVLRPDAARTTLGTLRVAGPLDVGVRRLRNRNGAAVPGAELRAISGLDVEVRDAAHALVMTGTFPTID